MMNDLLIDVYAAPKSQPQTPVPQSHGSVSKPLLITEDQPINGDHDESELVRKRPKSDNGKSGKKKRKQSKTDQEILEDIKAKFLS